MRSELHAVGADSACSSPWSGWPRAPAIAWTRRAHHRRSKHVSIHVRLSSRPTPRIRGFPRGC